MIPTRSPSAIASEKSFNAGAHRLRVIKRDVLEGNATRLDLSTYMANLTQVLFG